VLVELGRLDRRAVERQLRVIAGSEPSAAMAEGIWRRSEGNPLFVEELLAADTGDTESPRSVVEVLLARVARLGAGARIVVDATAVAGRPVDERLLADVLEMPEPEIDEGIRTALANGVLQLDAADERYRFRHELLRGRRARALPGMRRRLRAVRATARGSPSRRHEPVGAASEPAHPSPRQASSSRRTRARSTPPPRRGGVRVRRRAPTPQRALDLEPRLRRHGRRRAGVSLRRGAADDADFGGDSRGAGAEPRRAGAGRRATIRSRPASSVRIGYLQWSLGDSATALAAREAVRLVPPDPPTAERARVLASLGGALMGAGRWAGRRRSARQRSRAPSRPAQNRESRARNMLDPTSSPWVRSMQASTSPRGLPDRRRTGPRTC
jgi:hypothetical protein